MLGRELVTTPELGDETVTAPSRQDLDITDEGAVHRTVRSCRPDVVVNCAAWTAVDDAETHEDAALRVNGHGPGFLAAACAENGAPLLHISTDYVFGGGARQPYSEDDVPAPRTAYGRTKLAGERAVLQLLPRKGYVLRTAWLYGAHGPNFVRTMMGQERTRPYVRVVDDQHGQPTWTADVISQVIALARSGAPAGIYHATSSGETTWYGLAREIFRLLGADPDRVCSVKSSDFSRPAPRPGYSVLGHRAWARAGMAPIRNWRLSLRAALPYMTVT
jgi:dTDP-4-dehydrorhamnose reductase